MKIAVSRINVTLIVLISLSSLIQANPLDQTRNQPPERVIWDKKPIPFPLRVGQERLIHFPADIRYWIPDGIESVLRALSANGVLYLQALEPFEKVRLRIQAIDSQQMYLLDITSTEDGDYRQELVVLHKEKVPNLAKQAKPVTVKSDWFIRLTRFAAQSLYAPERLLPADTAIRRVSVNTNKPVNLVRGGELEALPVAAWRGGGLTITAIRLRNLSQHELVIANRPLNSTQKHIIDLRSDLRGDWLTASVQHQVIKAAGTDEDRTCLYVISKQRFEVSL